MNQTLQDSVCIEAKEFGALIPGKVWLCDTFCSNSFSTFHHFKNDQSPWFTFLADACTCQIYHHRFTKNRPISFDITTLFAEAFSAHGVLPSSVFIDDSLSIEKDIMRFFINRNVKVSHIGHSSKFKSACSLVVHSALENELKVK